MGKRKDGLERKAALLEAATKVFAEKGFRDATIAEICAAAQSNAASVNYYFGSKEALYAEAWKNAFQTAMDKYPPDMGLPPQASAEAQLRAVINSFLHKMLDQGQLGCYGKLLLMEMANPTDAIDEIKRGAIAPLRQRMISILRQLLGEQIPEQDVVFCAMSVIHQCLGFGFHRGQLPPGLRDFAIDGLHESLSEHITAFSLAGIAAVKAKHE